MLNPKRGMDLGFRVFMAFNMKPTKLCHRPHEVACFEHENCSWQALLNRRLAPIATTLRHCSRCSRNNPKHDLLTQTLYYS